MKIPHIGAVTKDPELGWYYSDEIVVPMLEDAICCFVLSGYDGKDDYLAAIANFLAADSTVLKQAEPYLFAYYEKCKDYHGEDDLLPIQRPSDIWEYVQLGNEPFVTRRAHGDRGVYVSPECGCDWEREQGLQIVFKGGIRVNKVGPYDGHVTHSDAFADDRLESVVFPTLQ